MANPFDTGPPPTPVLTPPERVTLVSVSEPRVNNKGKTAVAGYFRKGLFGKVVRRTFWAKDNDDGTLDWERASPAKLQALVGHDLTGTVEILPLDIEPMEIEDSETGDPLTAVGVTVVKFSDESLESCARAYGVTLRRQAGQSYHTPPSGTYVPGGDGMS
jgi:hypothetical protein